MTHEVVGKLVNNGKITIPKLIRELDDARDGDTVKIMYVGVLKKEVPK